MEAPEGLTPPMMAQGGYVLDANRDKRPHRAGWARGPYHRICQECERVFVGDKRAVTCAPCAYRDAPPADIPPPHDDAQPAEPVKYGGTGIDELNRAAEATQPAPEWSSEPPSANQ